MSKNNFHPDEEMLIEYHQGNLPYSHSLVISAHIEMCTQCREELRFFDAIGGAFLENCAPINLEDNALELALARIERPDDNAFENSNLQDFLKGFDVPSSIEKLDFEKRYWAAPGVWIAKVKQNKKDTSEAYLMYAKKGMQMPNHDHGGREITLVIQGSLEDDNGKFLRGDLMRAQEGFFHSPQIGSDIDCLCFIASEKPIIPKTILGKILQPFARI